MPFLSIFILHSFPNKEDFVVRRLEIQRMAVDVDILYGHIDYNLTLILYL